jgi:hypothetical protein
MRLPTSPSFSSRACTLLVLAAVLIGSQQAAASPARGSAARRAAVPTTEATEQAAFDRLTTRARRAVGHGSFGCLRTSFNNLTSLDLVVTRRSALPAARRLRNRLRAEAGGHLLDAARPYNHIASIEVASKRYGYDVMRAIFGQVHAALAPYPQTSVLFESVPYFAGAPRGHCCPVVARIPGGEPAAATQAARSLQTRFGADRIEIREAKVEVFPV